MVFKEEIQRQNGCKCGYSEAYFLDEFLDDDIDD